MGNSVPAMGDGVGRGLFADRVKRASGGCCIHVQALLRMPSGQHRPPAFLNAYMRPMRRYSKQVFGDSDVPATAPSGWAPAVSVPPMLCQDEAMVSGVTAPPGTPGSGPDSVHQVPPF